MMKKRKHNFVGDAHAPLAKRLCLYLGALGVIWASGAVHAQTSLDGDALTYVVQPGDTLYDISELYLENPAYWSELAEEVGVNNPRHLQPGQVIRLPLDQLRHHNKELRVAFQRGQASVTQGGETKPLVRDMILTEGQTIQTGPDGFVSLELPDGSKLFLSADTRIRITQFRYVPDANRELVEFLLEDGHVESSVTPQQPNSRFQVSTPLAVTGVRGTQFGVTFSPSGSQQSNDVIHGAVAVTAVQRPGAQARSVTLQAGQGSVFNSHMDSPLVSDLLPPPDLSVLPRYVHSQTWTLPLVADGASVTGYAVQVMPAGQPDQVIFESRGALETIHLPAQGQFELQVRALDANAVPGSVASHAFTVKLDPMPPLLQTPGERGYVGMESRTLVCTNVPDIERYLLQVARDTGFEEIVNEQVSENGCNFDFKPAATGTYYWRAASLDQSEDLNQAQGEFSSTGRFIVVNNPQTPQALEGRGDQGIVIYWSDVAPGSTYSVQVSDSPDFSNLVFSGQTQETEIGLGFSYSCDTLYVRMQSINPNGVASEFSAPRVLQTAQAWCSESGVAILDSEGNPIKASGN